MANVEKMYVDGSRSVGSEDLSDLSCEMGAALSDLRHVCGTVPNRVASLDKVEAWLRLSTRTVLLPDVGPIPVSVVGDTPSGNV
jgi:hypothetical protein